MTINNKKSINKLAIISTLLLSSCSSMPDALFPNGRPASHYEKMTVDQISSKVKVEYNDTENQTEYRSPKIESWKTRYLLRGWRVDKDKKVVNQLYLTLFYNDRSWRNYNSAISNGIKLKVKSLEKEVSSCSMQVIGYSCNYMETVGVSLPSGYLDNSKDGVRFRISSKAGKSKSVNLSGKYVKAYLSRLN